MRGIRGLGWAGGAGGGEASHSHGNGLTRHRERGKCQGLRETLRLRRHRSPGGSSRRAHGFLLVPTAAAHLKRKVET